MKNMKLIHYFFVFVSIWLFYKILHFYGLNLTLLDNYLDDVLLLPIVLCFALLIQRKLIAKNSNFRFHTFLIIFSVLYFCLMFEGIIPRFNKNYTADWLDCLAYAIGGFVFYQIQTKK
jgi:hypothetical protein